MTLRSPATPRSWVGSRILREPAVSTVDPMDAAYDSVMGLLRERGADAIAHPGGTLLAHLQRVEERLRRHGADDVVRLSALAHAAYGTDGFDKHLLRLDERRLLEQVTNTDVERLVYLYGACDRKKVVAVAR